jgi:hypothetical protein
LSRGEFSTSLPTNYSMCCVSHEQTCMLSRDAGTMGAAGASAPLAFCIFNSLGAVRVQTMGVTGAQNFYNRQN